jgi:hypothetical protein
MKVMGAGVVRFGASREELAAIMESNHEENFRTATLAPPIRSSCDACAAKLLMQIADGTTALS